jgi:TPR repeat protein
MPRALVGVCLFPLLLLGLCLTPYARTHVTVVYSFASAAAVFLVWIGVLWFRKRDVRIAFRPIKSHYVQALVQTCVYVYWGWYWRPVYEHVPLILAQLAFVYALDALLGLTRRQTWTLGFGPFPIILSTNFFLLFRPDWFPLQFVMNALGVLGKEFIRWNRDGRDTHIFNPSAFGLGIVSLGLLITQTTDRTWGEQIATTLNNPPHIYLQIFLVGLIVQALFSVTLVTLCAVIALVVLNLGYTAATGVYYFFDSTIPIAVFLGLHLLVTDPATSPRTNAGKVQFGVAYGLGVFMLYGILESLGLPRFYDKLLPVPVLNLMVPLFDRGAAWLRTRARWTDRLPAVNWAHMAMWVAVFSTIYAARLVGPGHKGAEVAFWQSACANGFRSGCSNLVRMQSNRCRGGNAEACLDLGALHSASGVRPDPVLRGQSLALGCDLGLRPACLEFERYARLEDGIRVLEDSCTRGQRSDCYIMGLVYRYGIARAPDIEAAVARWTGACSPEWPRACAELGGLFFFGDAGIGTDVTRALEYLDRACDYRDAASCANLGAIYRQGRKVDQSPELASLYLAKACAIGLRPACE